MEPISVFLLITDRYPPFSLKPSPRPDRDWFAKR